MKIVTIIHYSGKVVIPDNNGKLYDHLVTMIQNSDIASVTADSEEQKLRMIIPRKVALNSIISVEDQ